jgi:cystathionine beta-synthase
MEKGHELTAADVAVRGPSDDGRQVIAVPPDATVAEAVECMTRNAISQVPVIKDGDVVGSLEEVGILHLLVSQPESRSRLVQDVMGAPPPIIESSLPARELSARLEQPPGAVLIPADRPGTYRIITKTDLITALARHNGI